MSLFPAYADTALTEDKKSTWLENDSYQASTTSKNENVSTIIVSSSSELTCQSDTQDTPNSKAPKKRKKTKKKKSKKSKSSKTDEPSSKILLEFNGDEEFYVDKKPTLSYKTVCTLHRPACPRYYKYTKRCLHIDGTLKDLYSSANAKPPKRYYREARSLKALDSETQISALDENEYTSRLGQLNRKVLETPNELNNWLELIKLQNQNPYKWSRLLLAERKIDIVRRAIVYHQGNDTLFHIFIDTISDTYPAFEVSKLLDGLLSKDSYSYTLWTAQIMATQGSMARCVVPDVLQIYERCMGKMHHSPKQTTSFTMDTDMIMLKLFNNCALFLRQAGLYEQFFALVKLAIELNITTIQSDGFKPSDQDQKTLVEYEELILQSGLPMNEIWLRIEKLRQCFNFLPCPMNSECSDPQRIVFNEDICHYIYPLKNTDNSFYLMLLIFRLLKLPFVKCDGLAAKFSARVDAIGDSDAIEEALALGLRTTFASIHSKEQFEFFNSLHELAKEMVVTPTFLSSSIGNEIYVKCVTSLLLSTSAAYAGIDEKKRIIFLLLLCRFERLCLVLEKSAKKLTPQYIKSARSRFKAVLKQTANRNCLPLYTELALFEYEAAESEDSLETFESIIASIDDDASTTYVCFAEILIGRGMNEQASQVLASYILKVDIKQKSSISTARQLAAFKQICEKVDGIVTVERNVEIMVLEQYLLPDQTVTLLKLRCLLKYLIGQKMETLTYLDKLMKIFCNMSERHQFLRERIYEMYIIIAQLPSSNCVVSNAALSTKIFEAIKSYPRNLYFLQTCGMLKLPWYKIRTAMLGAEPNILGVTFLIAAARFRFLATLQSSNSLPFVTTNSSGVIESDQRYNESIVRNRVLHIFLNLTDTDTDTKSKNECNEQRISHKALRRNALFWRFYLRCLSDQGTAFETSKKCLLTALDDCPWSKALYMDGATYVPQELSHLQDLMIEKHLRVYALPEELEILRER